MRDWAWSSRWLHVLELIRMIRELLGLETISGRRSSRGFLLTEGRLQHVVRLVDRGSTHHRIVHTLHATLRGTHAWLRHHHIHHHLLLHHELHLLLRHVAALHHILHHLLLHLHHHWVSLLTWHTSWHPWHPWHHYRHS